MRQRFFLRVLFLLQLFCHNNRAQNTQHTHEQTLKKKNGYTKSNTWMRGSQLFICNEINKFNCTCVYAIQLYYVSGTI